MGDFPGRPVVKTSPSNAGGAGLIPAWGVKIPRALWRKKQHQQQKQYCNKFNKRCKKKMVRTKQKRTQKVPLKLIQGTKEGSQIS